MSTHGGTLRNRVHDSKAKPASSTEPPSTGWLPPLSRSPVHNTNSISSSNAGALPSSSHVTAEEGTSLYYQLEESQRPRRSQTDLSKMTLDEMQTMSLLDIGDVASSPRMATSTIVPGSSEPRGDESGSGISDARAAPASDSAAAAAAGGESNSSYFRFRSPATTARGAGETQDDRKRKSKNSSNIHERSAITNSNLRATSHRVPPLSQRSTNVTVSADDGGDSGGPSDHLQLDYTQSFIVSIPASMVATATDPPSLFERWNRSTRSLSSSNGGGHAGASQGRNPRARAYRGSSNKSNSNTTTYVKAAASVAKVKEASARWLHESAATALGLTKAKLDHRNPTLLEALHQRTETKEQERGVNRSESALHASSLVHDEGESLERTKAMGSNTLLISSTPDKHQQQHLALVDTPREVSVSVPSDDSPFRSLQFRLQATFNSVGTAVATAAEVDSSGGHKILSNAVLARQPHADSSHPSNTAAAAAALIAKWEDGVRSSERVGGARSLQLARELFANVVQGSRHYRPLVASGQEQMALLAARAAVSAALLETVVAHLPRHQAVLVPYVEMLLQYVYVPDTQSIREAIGDVAYNSVLDGLGGDEHALRRCASSYSTAMPTTTSVTDGDEPRWGTLGVGSNITARPSIATTSAYRDVSSGSHATTAVTATTTSAAGGTFRSTVHSSTLMSVTTVESLALTDRFDETAHHLRVGRELDKEKRGGGKAGNTTDGNPHHQVVTVADMQYIMAQYARKPYFIAHAELSRNVVLLAHRVRAQQLHFHRLPLIFSMMQASWSHTLLRTVLRMWHNVCIQRRMKEQKHRHRWGKRWAFEKLRVNIRHWRSFAAFTFKSAEADNIARALIVAKKDAIRVFNAGVSTMQGTSRTLTTSMEAKVVERAALEVTLAEKEQQYKAVLEQVREMDSVGSLLLDSLLLHEAPPEVIKPEVVEDERQHCYVSALSMMVAWAERLLETVGVETEDICEMSASVMFASVTSPNGLGESATSPARSKAPLTPSNAANSMTSINVMAITASCPKLSALITEELLYAPNELVCIPFYKFLVLMRCFGSDEPCVPAIEVVRTVKSADSSVLKELLELQQREGDDGEDAPHIGGGGDGAAGGRRSLPTSVQKRNADSNSKSNHRNGDENESLVYQLSTSARSTAEDVARILVDSYERLTNSVCVVTAEQLVTRSRGVLLVFLAALFRHYTNWIVRSGRGGQEVIEAAAAAANIASPLNLLANESVSTASYPRSPQVAARALLAGADYTGRRHPKYANWYFPPHSHDQWLMQVSNQRKWIASALSAMHRSIEVATFPSNELALHEQDAVADLMKSLVPTQIEDVLPMSGENTTHYYVALLRVVERRYQSLRKVFEMYALSIRDVRRARGEVVEEDKSEDEDDHKHQERKDQKGIFGGEDGNQAQDDSDSDDSDSNGSNKGGEGEGDDDESKRERKDRRRKTQRKKKKPEKYISAADFWRLLKDAGLAGTPGPKWETWPIPLHRAAVFSIVEHVTLHTLVLQQATEAAAAAAAGGDGRKYGAFGPHRSSAVVPLSKVAVPMPSAPLLVQVGKNRVLPHFARAVQENRHVDLRHDRATVCMNMAQFVEAIIRCAHTWQCINRTDCVQRAEEAEAEAEANNKDGGPIPLSSSLSNSGTLSTSTPAVAAHRLKDRGNNSAGSRSSVNVTPSTSPRAGGVAAPATTTVIAAAVCYPTGDYTEPLNPQVLDSFLGVWLVPRLLGGIISPVQVRQVCRGVGVRLFLAAQQEELFRVFSSFSKPREAVGIRGALPPPFFFALERQRMQQNNDVGGDGGGIMSPLQQRRVASRHRVRTRSGVGAGHGGTGGAVRRGSNSGKNAVSTGKVRDVGIVSVMSFAEVQVLAKEKQWYRVPRINDASLKHCLYGVLADASREGDAIFFPEFLDLLCAVAHYYDANPMVPLEKKLKDFVLTRVLSE